MTTTFFALPAMGSSKTWAWTDLSASLPYRDGQITIVSERNGSFLSSDSQHLMLTTGTVTKNLTTTARANDLQTISSISSDEMTWFVVGRNSNGQLLALITDGSTWTNITTKFPANLSEIRASGKNGVWYLITKRQTNNETITELWYLNGTNSQPTPFFLPNNNQLELRDAGCVRNANNHVTCHGQTKFINVNGAWFLIGGRSEIRDNANNVIQTPATTLYRVNGTAFSQTTILPNDRFISGIWSSPTQTLIATSELGNTPNIISNLYAFNGNSVKNINNVLASANVYGVDAREIKAAYNGLSWMIVLGKNIYRFDGNTLINEGKTRDVFHAIAASNNNSFLLGGAVSTIESNFASNPLTTKLTMVKETKTVTTVTSTPTTSTTVSTPIQPWTGKTFITDSGNGIRSTAWLNGTSLTQTNSVKYSVAAEDTDGIGTIDLWVNGFHVSTCNMNKAKGVQVCEYNIIGADIKPDTMVFVNAKITDGSGRFTWTSGLQIKREPNPVTVTVTNPTTSTSATVTTTAPIINGPQNYVRSALNPNTSKVTRGTKLQYQTFALNNTIGVLRMDVYGAGQLIRSCSFGGAVSEVSCSIDIDTSSWTPTQSNTYMVRMITSTGQEYWGETRTVTVASTITTAQTSPISGFTQWTWMTPSVNELIGDQTTKYGVGTWSPNGVQKIEMIVDGLVRKTCTSTTAEGNKECELPIKTADWAHGKILAINARITDTKGNIIYSEPKFLTIKQDWTSIDLMKANTTISTNRAEGYNANETVTVYAKGWAASGLDRVEIFANGSKVASCPSDICQWTSAPLTGAVLELSARTIDRSARETWTPIQAIYRK